MKKTKLLLLAMLVMVAALSGCSKDDDFSIIGTWQQESLQLYIKPSTSLPEILLHEEQNEGVTITFNENGTGLITEGEESQAFNWELSNSKLTIAYSGTSLNLTLGTKTNNKITGEQSMTKEELTEILAMFDTEGIDLSVIDQFPNLVATLKIVFVK